MENNEAGITVVGVLLIAAGIVAVILWFVISRIKRNRPNKADC